MIETEGLTGADTLLRVLSHMGVDRIFASPGSEWAPVWEAFAKAKAQSEGVPLYISSRHEEAVISSHLQQAIVHKSSVKITQNKAQTNCPSSWLVLSGSGL